MTPQSVVHPSFLNRQLSTAENNPYHFTLSWHIILMFHCFHTQPLRINKRTTGKVIDLVVIDSNHIAVLDEHNALTTYRLPAGAVESHLVLPFKARRMTVSSTSNIIVLSAQQRSVFQVSLMQGKVEKMMHFKPSHHYHTQQVELREREYFTTMVLACFAKKEACFLREQRSEERRVRLHFLKKMEGEWKNSCQQLPMNHCIQDIMDEESRVAIWKQQITTNGEFDFTSLDLETMAKEDIHVESASFTSFSIVRAIKATREGCLVCVNQKDPQILFFSKNKQGHDKEQAITTNLLWIAPYDRFTLTLCLSEEEKSFGRVEVRREGGSVMDKTETLSQRQSISKQGQLLISYQREGKETGTIGLVATRVLRKQKLYLHLMESFSKQSKIALNNSFMREVLAFLN